MVILISCPKKPCRTLSRPRILAAFSRREPEPQAGSIKTLCLIQKEKPSPVRKYRKRLDLLDFHGTCRLWKPSFFIQLCSSATAAIGPKSEMRHPKLLSLKSMLTLKSLSLDNRPQQRKYTLIILVFGFNKGCRQNGD